MPRSGAKIGSRTQFLREDPVDSGTYVPVAEVKSINGPSQSRDAVEATHLESDDDHTEYVPGIAEPGEVSLTLNFRPEHTSQGSSAGLYKDFQDGAFRNWRTAFPQFGGTPTLQLAGFLTGWEPSIATKDLLTVAVKLKVSGKVTATSFA